VFRRRGQVALALALAFIGAPAGASADSVMSGRLGAELTPAPWSLDFSDRERGSILRERAETGLGPTGTLGFRTPLGWFHATEASALERDGKALVATVETTDPLRTLAVRVEPAGPGVVRVLARVEGPATADVEATGIGFDAPAGERFLGFGERSNAVDQRGNTVENYVADGPYQTEEYPFLTPFIPPAGIRIREDSTYFPMPWLLSSAGHGVLVENSEVSRFRLGSEEASAWSLEVESEELAFRVFAGPSPAGVVRRLTRFTGRQPRSRAAWFHGPWYQPHDGGEHDQAAALREDDVPGSVAQTYTH
jgi:hypothetical protein